MSQAKREVLLGALPDVELSKRIPAAIDRLREERGTEVSERGLVLKPSKKGGSRLWTWAGFKANATLLAGLGLEAQGVENDSILLPDGVTIDNIKASDPDAVPQIGANAVSGLKFSAALPPALALRTLGERLADPAGASATAQTAIVSLYS